MNAANRTRDRKFRRHWGGAVEVRSKWVVDPATHDFSRGAWHLDVTGINADLSSHHIEGIAREGYTPFSCPLVSQVTENLWQGGCIQDVSLEGRFKHIINLYVSEEYNPGGRLDTNLKLRLYDAAEVPNQEQLYAVARLVNVCRALGPTLVHCQAGLNRSGLVTGLALFLGGMDASHAVKLLRAQRSPAVLCNKAFENWLLTKAVR